MPTNSKEKTPWDILDYGKFVYFTVTKPMENSDVAFVLNKDEKTVEEFRKLEVAILENKITPEIKKQLKSNKYNALIDAVCNLCKVPDPRIKIKEEEERAKQSAQSSKTGTGPNDETEYITLAIDADQMARFMYVLGKMEEKLEEIEKAINANADVRTQQIQDLKSSIQCALKKKQL